MLWHDKWVSEMTQAFDLPRQKSLDRILKGLIHRPDPVVVPIKSIFALSADPSLTSWTRESTQTEYKGTARPDGTPVIHVEAFLEKGRHRHNNGAQMAFCGLLLRSSPSSCHKCTDEPHAFRPPTSSVPPLLLVRSFTLTNDRSRGECCV